ncbi:MAG: aminodeoxychorismate synthase component I [Candidatus Omnitrophica bacterium]|nr:aminodeoxychorismate synthase component I [Candidatus Omnitrophota bacterium]
MTSEHVLRQFLTTEKEGVLLYDALTGDSPGTVPNKNNKKTNKSYLFVDPLKTIRCNTNRDLIKSIGAIERYLKLGCHAAGYFSYEAGYALESKFTGTLGRGRWPMLHFGIYRGVYEITDLDLDEMIPVTPEMDDFWVRDFKPSISKQEYSRQFAKIKEYIKAGDVYQINYCFNLDFTMQGSVAALFNALTKRQKVSYAALIKTKDECILSLSPEMFFEVENKKITMKPMKGTLLRSRSAATNKQALARFNKSEKNHAENLMIVDLIRNDCSRFCKPDTVKTPRLFTVEEYETLYQMTSTITGELKPNTPLSTILTSLFPSGSVTGAPKIRAMEIINEVEKGPRGVYTGAIGFIAPHKKRMIFNIPIRTMVIDQRKGRGTMGIGSGVVVDSRPDLEYKECVGKARFLTGLEKQHQLIETMLFEPKKGIFLLDLHLKRLLKSARFFNIPADEDHLREELKKSVKRLKNTKKHKIRLLLNTKGQCTITSTVLRPPKRGDSSGTVTKIRVSSVKTDPSNIFWYHKTTNRGLYDLEYKKARKELCCDTIFTNTHGEVTEGCISTIFAKKDGIFYTPPVRCGLLPGVYREHVLKTDRVRYREKVLSMYDLKDADAIYLGNSVRGMTQVVLEDRA